MPRVTLPIGTSDFAEIRREGWYYVDKTGLIRDLLNTRKAKVTLITRPRRFGKTLGMNMLASFHYSVESNQTENNTYNGRNHETAPQKGTKFVTFLGRFPFLCKMEGR